MAPPVPVVVRILVGQCPARDLVFVSLLHHLPHLDAGLDGGALTTGALPSTPTIRLDGDIDAGIILTHHFPGKLAFKFVNCRKQSAHAHSVQNLTVFLGGRLKLC